MARECAAGTCEQLLRSAGALDSEGAPVRLAKGTELDAPLKNVKITPPVDPRPTEDRSAQTVKIELLIDPEGHPILAKVIDSNDRRLTAAILTVVKSWEFTKPSKNGNAVTTRIALPIVFKGPSELNSESIAYRHPVVMQTVSPRFPFFGTTAGTERSYVMSDGGGFGVFSDKASDTGLVVLGFDIDASGAVKNIEVKQSSESGYSGAAISALKQWKFLPGISGGRAVSMAMTLQFRFMPPYYIWTGVPYRNFSAATEKPAGAK